MQCISIRTLAAEAMTHKEWQSGTEGRRCLEWCRVEDGEGVLEIKWGGIELSGMEGNCDGWMG